MFGAGGRSKAWRTVVRCGRRQQHRLSGGCGGTAIDAWENHGMVTAERTAAGVIEVVTESVEVRW